MPEQPPREKDSSRGVTAGLWDISFEEELGRVHKQVREGDALRARLDVLWAKLDTLKARRDELSAKQDEISAKEDELKAKRDAFEAKQQEFKALRNELIAQWEQLYAEDESFRGLVNRRNVPDVERGTTSSPSSPLAAPI